ncbi:uncharacterized protein At4g04775-like [Gastrolobium bilobum]|uniref:uncharacterized protein At4g04775-like n=1 Tax=Gastrolobium bilobum TaxID=150636 RepID=UPI002AAF661C|nr:uncharacterized protein At4g04775-like [Gastrolobium bilobum]
MTRTAGWRCKCGRQSIVYTSKTERNPNRAFLGCPNFKEKKPYCDFFRWVDDMCNEPMELEEARINTVELDVAEINFKLKYVEMMMREQDVKITEQGMKLHQQERKLNDKLHTVMHILLLIAEHEDHLGPCQCYSRVVLVPDKVDGALIGP